MFFVGRLVFPNYGIFTFIVEICKILNNYVYLCRIPVGCFKNNSIRNADRRNHGNLTDTLHLTFYYTSMRNSAKNCKSPHSGFRKLVAFLFAAAAVVGLCAAGEASGLSTGNSPIASSQVNRARVPGTLMMPAVGSNLLIDRNRPENTQQVSPFAIPGEARLKVAPAAESKRKRTAAADAVPEVTLYASILSDTKSTTYGIYSIPSIGGEFTRATYGPWAMNGGVYQNGKYFYSMRDSYMGMMINRSALLDVENNWRTIKEVNDDMSCVLMATAMANNPLTNQAYGCFYASNGNSLEFGIIDIDNFTRTTIAPLTKAWSAAGFSSDGTLYVILNDGNLAKVNLETGANTIIGQTGLPIQNATSGTIDYRTDTFYYATSSDEDNAVYAINLTTAVPTKLFDTPNSAQLGGMFILYPNISEEAPGAVTDMVLNFEGTSLDGTVGFTAPSVTFGGAPLTGALNYEVAVNGKVKASGTCQAGVRTEAPLTLNEAGKYTFEVKVSKGGAVSDGVKITRWIGADAPQAPQNVVLVANGLDFSLSWDAVTGSANGGYFNPADITYTVTRYPGAHVVSTAQKGTTFSETVEEPASVVSFYYTVVANSGEVSSAEGRSNAVQTGNIHPPYSETFDDANSLNNFTIIDANNDGATWEFYYNYVRSKFHSDNSSDDWLVTAPVRLEAGKVYDLSYDIKAFNASYPERYEVCMGSRPEASALTQVLLPPTEVTSNTYSRKTVQLIPENSGVYYIGFHAISDKNMFYLCLDNLSIGAPYEGDTPGKATDFHVTPDYDGKVMATVSFKAPAITTNDTPLEGDITKIVVSRNDEVVHTFGTTAPGAECSFVDQAQEIGMYSYTITAYNKYGAGAKFSADGRLGVNLAPAALNPRITETSEGKVKISWDAPATDIDGFPLNPSAIHYAILDKTGNVVLAEDLAANEFDIDVIEPGSRQTFVFYYIMTQTAAGVNYDDYVYTPQIAIGTPYAYPWSESFAGGSVSSAWAITRNNGGKASWGVGPSSAQPVANPQDQDGGLAAFMPYEAGEEALFHSAKITIPGNARAPHLSFWYFGVNGSADRLDVQVAEAHGDFSTLKSLTLADNGAGWHRVLVDLGAYRGKTIEVGFNGVCVTAQNLIVIDNIKVTDVLDNNVMLSGFHIPTHVVAGAKTTLTATISNTGKNEAVNVYPDIYRDGVLVGNGNAQALNPDSEVKVRIPDKLPVNLADEVCYEIRLRWDADMLSDDNSSGVVKVKSAAPAAPRVTDLRGGGDGESIRLDWTAPADGAPADEMLESFEDAESFEINSVEGWTFADRDGQTTYGIENATFPNNGEPMAFIVVDGTHNAFTGFDISTGSKCLASFSCDNGTQNDDWAISPLLSGEAQTVMFMARSYTTRYGFDSFEFLYSTTDNNPDSFTLLGTDTKVPETWTSYSYTLPEGALYFAIRCTSTDTFMFMIDDVMLTPAAYSNIGRLSLDGFAIYRDDMVAGITSDECPWFSESLADDTFHTYYVTCLYNSDGLGNYEVESAPSNFERVSRTALADVNYRGISAWVEGDAICVSNPDGETVALYRPDGSLVFSKEGAEGRIAEVSPGIYIVSIGSATIKVAVE